MRSLIFEWKEKNTESHLAACGPVRLGADMVGGKWLWWAALGGNSLGGWKREYDSLIDAQRAAERFALSIYNKMKRDLPYKAHQPVGYMCKVDFDFEVGAASGGNVIYPSEEDCKHYRKCTDACGMVKVQIKHLATVKKESRDEE